MPIFPYDPLPLDPTEGGLAEYARAVALALLAFADGIERAPRRLGGPLRYRGRSVMPRSLHDVWCGWRIATRDEERPDLAWCAGCGLAVEIGAAAAEK